MWPDILILACQRNFLWQPEAAKPGRQRVRVLLLTCRRSGQALGRSNVSWQPEAGSSGQRSVATSRKGIHRQLPTSPRQRHLRIPSSRCPWDVAAVLPALAFRIMTHLTMVVMLLPAGQHMLYLRLARTKPERYRVTGCLSSCLPPMGAYWTLIVLVSAPSLCRLASPKLVICQYS